MENQRAQDATRVQNFAAEEELGFVESRTATGNECKTLPLERNYGSENQKRETMADVKLRQRGFLANNPQASTSYGGESMAPTHIEILQPKERHVGRGEWEEQKEKQQQHEEDQRMAARHELHDGLSFPQYMLAGSVAGMVEHMAMFPVDLVKTRMQMLESAGGFGHRGVYKAFFSIVKKEGPMGLYRGIGAMGLGAGPAHAVYFAVYETVKQKLGGNRVGHHPLLHAMAGACATVASDAVFTPMDVVKQRLQLRRSPYRGVFDCMQRILKEEGVNAFYKSYPTTILMNIPFTAVHFAAYEAGKKVREESQCLEAEILLHLLFSKSNTEFWEQ